MSHGKIIITSFYKGEAKAKYMEHEARTEKDNFPGSSFSLALACPHSLSFSPPVVENVYAFIFSWSLLS